ncbi:hypothetical protein [Rhodoflexus sp.]
MKLLVGILLLFCLNGVGYARTNLPKFRITSIKEVSGCKEGVGILFEQGYINAIDRNRQIQVALYIEKTNGAFEIIRKSYPPGTINVKLNLFGCDYTGNHYAYAKYADDRDFYFPTLEDIYIKHKEVLETQTPEFVITTTKTNPNCNHVPYYETGFVWSPAGGRVNIKLLLETTSGEWRTINLYHYGTGKVKIHHGSCDLTGKVEIIASFGYVVNLSALPKR